MNRSSISNETICRAISHGCPLFKRGPKSLTGELGAICRSPLCSVARIAMAFCFNVILQANPLASSRASKKIELNRNPILYPMPVLKFRFSSNLKLWSNMVKCSFFCPLFWGGGWTDWSFSAQGLVTPVIKNLESKNLAEAGGWSGNWEGWYLRF